MTNWYKNEIIKDIFYEIMIREIKLIIRTFKNIEKIYRNLKETRAW